MTTTPDPQGRERNRAVWEAGDWDLVAPRIEAAGPRLLDRLASVGDGVRLLDVGTGSGGSVAIPAAQRGVDVVGSDITDAWFDPRAGARWRPASRCSGSSPTPSTCPSRTARSTSSPRRSATCSRPTRGGRARARARLSPRR